MALAASGTVSLELAANSCPMVIAYDMHPLTLWLMRRAALVDTVTLVNLVSETRVVPEFIGPDCRPEKIAPALDALLAGQRRAEGRDGPDDGAAGQGRRAPRPQGCAVGSVGAAGPSGASRGAASPLMIARTCGISGPILSVDQRRKARLLRGRQLRQLCHGRPAFGRGIEIAQCGDLGQGHDVGHELGLLAHQGGHRLGEGIGVKLVDLGHLVVGQPLAGGGDLLQDRLRERVDDRLHVEALQREVDIFRGDRHPLFAGFGEGGQRQGKGQRQDKVLHDGVPFQTQPPPKTRLPSGA